MATVKKSFVPKELFVIVKDTREKSGWNFRASANCDGMVRRKLDVGDYTIEGLEDKIMVERKSLADLYQTLGRQENYKRFLREMDRAKDHRIKYLVIEATLGQVAKGYRYSKVPPNNIFAKLASLEVKHGVHVVYAGRPDIARQYVRQLFIKLDKYHKDGII